MSHQQITTFPFDPVLDLDTWVGQRSATFEFHLLNGVTGEPLGELHPLFGASLSHDTGATIKRQLSFGLGVSDASDINVITDRVDLSMVLGDGRKFPLGRYMFTGSLRRQFTSGTLAAVSLADEMFKVDQPIDTGIDGISKGAAEIINEALTGLDVTVEIEAAEFASNQSWGIGTSRGSILEAVSVSSDYFSPWFGNDKKLHYIRTFNPATRLPDFDFDLGNRVLRDSITNDDDLITAPNRIIVISNASNDSSQESVGVADIPQSAPHSIVNRGFIIPQVENLQLSDSSQAAAVAEGLAQRFTVFERVQLSTPPDPRHDSYNVIKWQGEKWLELAWTMNLQEGGAMTHSLRKAYA